MASTPTKRAHLDGVRADEVLPGPALCRRLGIGRHTLAQLRRQGLRPIKLGRGFLYRGADVLALVDRLADEQEVEGER